MADQIIRNISRASYAIVYLKGLSVFAPRLGGFSTHFRDAFLYTCIALKKWASRVVKGYNSVPCNARDRLHGRIYSKCDNYWDRILPLAFPASNTWEYNSLLVGRIRVMIFSFFFLDLYVIHLLIQKWWWQSSKLHLEEDSAEDFDLQQLRSPPNRDSGRESLRYHLINWINVGGLLIIPFISYFVRIFGMWLTILLQVS